MAIQQNITQQSKDLVCGIKTASAMWAKLKKHYEGKGRSLKSHYLAEIQELDYSSNKFSDITAFIVAFQNLYSQIGQVGMELPNDYYTIMFIKAMSGAFPVWADKWRSSLRTIGDKLTLDMLYEDITDKARDRQPTTTNTDVAMYRNNPKGNCNKKKKKDKDDKDKFIGNCNHCQKYGHKAKYCWIKHPEKKPKKEPAAALAPSGLAMYAEAAMVSNAFENCWLVDTGANYHLCHDQALF